MMKFPTRESLATFLIETESGRRLVRWILGTYWKRIVASGLHMEIEGRAAEQHQKDMEAYGMAEPAKSGNVATQKPGGPAAAASRAERVKVIAEIGADGMVRLFASESIQLAWVQRLEVQTVQAEIMEEELAEYRLPHWARSIYYPKNLVGQKMYDRISVSEYVRKREYAKHVRLVSGRARATGGRAVGKHSGGH